VILLNDWDVRTVDELWDSVRLSGPPTVDNALINGSNLFGQDGRDQVGRRFEMSFMKGKSYRLRLGNAACDTHLKFSIFVGDCGGFGSHSAVCDDGFGYCDW
jgi:hypothetical protein